jgi:hypothetical protein
MPSLPWLGFIWLSVSPAAELLLVLVLLPVLVLLLLLL